MKRLAALVLLSVRCVAIADEPAVPEIITATFARDVPTVRRLLDAGADPNREFGLATPLHIAAEYGYTELAELLVAKGANVDARDEGGDSPLAWAAANGHDGAARLLMEHGAEPLAANDAGTTPLLWAVNGRHSATVKLLLARIKKIPARDAPALLSSAVQWGDIAVLRLLLDSGASSALAGDGAARLFGVAGRGGSIEVVKALSDRIRAVRSKRALLSEALNLAAENGHLPVVRFLLDTQKLDANRQSEFQKGRVVRIDSKSEDFSPLSRAVEAGHDEIARLLLARGARVAGRTGPGEPLLLYVLARGRDAMFASLLEHKAPLDAADFDGRTALMFAAAHGRLDIVRTLVGRGASVKKKDAAGATALLLACGGGHRDCIELLLAHGAKAGDRDAAGRGAVGYAAASGNAELCRLLFERGATLAAEANGRTPLHIAAEDGQAAVVKTLLELGAPAAARDAAGRTPLDEAQAAGQAEVVELLKATDGK